MVIDWVTFAQSDQWKYFSLPPEEEQRLRMLFTIKVGLKITQLVDNMLLDMSYDDPFGHREKTVFGIGNASQIAGAMCFIIGDFIAQYHKLGRSYKLPLLPAEIMPFFRYPFNQFQDLNLKAQNTTMKRLTKKYKRGLSINAG